MGIGDIRYTVLQTVQEVFRKLGLDAPSALTSNKLSIEMVDFVNDVCNDLSDFGDWPETIVSANVTAVEDQSDYTISTSANIKNIGDIYFGSNTGRLRNITLADMRQMTRTTAKGTPTQYTIFGTDSNGNPNLRMRPIPGSAEAGKLFSITYFSRPPRYTTGDGALTIAYPARVVVLGVMAKHLLNESGGAPNDKYSQVYQDYLMARKEALNRFTGDTGWDISFRPSLGNQRRRR